MILKLNWGGETDSIMQGYPASIITIYGAPKSIIGFPLPTYSYLPSHGSEITLNCFSKALFR